MGSATTVERQEAWSGTTYGYHTYRSRSVKGGGQVAPEDRLEAALERSRQYLLAAQHPEEGLWVGELEANATITAEYIFFMHFMGTVDDLRQRKIVRYLLETQLPSGGWSLYHGGPPDLSTTVEAYCAMKIAGEDPARGPMARAREVILDQGGPERSRVFTKLFLALLGLYPWDRCPALPPELMLLPAGSTLSIYGMSSWARCTVVPLLLIRHHKPVAAGLQGLTLDELSPSPAPGDAGTDADPPPSGEERAFFLADRLLKLYDRRPARWIRRRALRKAEAWILERQDATGEWGGIQPAMVNSLMALKCLGYPLSHPVMRKGLDALHRFAVEDRRTLRLQSSVSPVWDTVNASLALLESGLPSDDPALERAVRWLGARQTVEPGDWAVKNPETPPGGWSFEFANSFYPDNDDTLAVLTLLKRTGADRRAPDAWQCGLDWLLSMQSSRGGWAAFDIDNEQAFWNRIPFADHKSMLDPPTSDLTGRVLEFLGEVGFRLDHPPVRGAVSFLEAEQEADGPWNGRWGVNYLYGTWCALCGLQAVGYDMGAERIRRAVDWLASCQNPDGGWGESCLSYEDPLYRGRGDSTASQTAWALMGLLAAGEAPSGTVRRGVEFLLRTQNRHGSWDEEAFTGTGFPRFFYLRYHMYRDYFPLMALGRYRRAVRKGRAGGRAR